MTFEELLDQVLEEDAKKQIANLQDFTRRLRTVDLHHEVVRELNDIHAEHHIHCVTISSGLVDYDSQLYVCKLGEDWHINEDISIRYDYFTEKPAVEQIKVGLNKLRNKIKLIDAVSRNTDRDKWQMEFE